MQSSASRQLAGARSSSVMPTSGYASSAVSRAAAGRVERLTFGSSWRWVRDATDLLRLAFLVGVPVVLIFGPRSEGLRLLLTFGVCLLPRMLATPRPFDLAFTAAMSLQAWGNVAGAFDAWLPFHVIVHFTLTMATAALFYVVLVRLRLVPDIARAPGVHEKLGMAILVFAIGSFVGAVYEEYEWFAINVLGAGLTENYQHDIDDLIFNALGSVGAGLLLVLWARRGWTTRRDDPGDPLGGVLRGFERRLRPTEAGRLPRPTPHHDARDPFARYLSQWARAPLDLLGLSFLVGALLAAVNGDWEATARFGVSFIAAVLAGLVRLPPVFESLWVAGLAFEAWGGYAGAFHQVPGYLQWTYVVIAAASAPLLYMALVRLRVFPVFERAHGIHRGMAVFLASMCLGYCVGIYYDLYIWLANHTLGASFPVSWDGLTAQLALQWLGAAAGAVAILVWEAHGNRAPTV